MTASSSLDVAAVKREIARVPRWRHRITLPGGIVTPGTQDTLTAGVYFGIPDDLTGKSVLDIGCSDGYFSFECERRGAAHVLAIEDFSSVFVDAPIGFNVAHRLLGSQVEFRQMDLFDLDPRVVGAFDLVLFLGVLYHLRHPLLALERIASVCRGQLIIETLIAPEPRRLERLVAGRFGRRSARYMKFYEGDEVNRDPTNWWPPSPAGMLAMLRSCGFCDVQMLLRSTGVFHAFDPRHGDDVERLVERHGAQLVARAAAEILAEEVLPNSVSDRLRAVSISQFAAVRQHAAELPAKQWHQKTG